jgi:hypothetical protein
MKIVKFIAVFSAIICLFSCSVSEDKSEMIRIVENRDAKELLNDLYIGSEGNIEALSRILQASPSTIQRIRKGETIPTEKFEEKIREVSIYYVENDQKFSKLRSVLDSEYGWYDSVLNFPIHRPWLFWITNIIAILLLAFLALIVIWFFLAELLIFCIVWLISWGMSLFHTMPIDKYIETINPVLELPL